MSVSFHLEDGHGSNRRVVVTQYGELAVGQLHYSSSTSANLDVVDTAYNLIAPREQQEHIIITGMALTANRNVGTSDSSIQVYTSDIGPDSRTQETLLIQTELAKNDTLVLNPIAIEVPPAKWVNAECNDDDVFVTLLYYYIKEFE